MTFCSVLSDSYVPLMVALLKSMKRHGLSDKRFIIFTTEEELNLLSRQTISSIYPVEYQNIDFDAFMKNGKGFKRYWSINAFKVDDEKVIFLDADLLCLASFNELINSYNSGLWMVKELRRPSFNAGLIIINKQFLGEDVYKSLLEYTPPDGTFGTDQAVYNSFFDGKIAALDTKYNNLVSEVQPDAVFLHYIFKPTWKKGRDRMPSSLINKWESAYNA